MDELETLAKHCTEEEDAAKKVERQVAKSAAAMLLESRIGEQFDAIVTGAAPKGTWVRLLSPPVEGRLVHGFEGVDVGHRIRVRLIDTDIDRGFIDFKMSSSVKASPVKRRCSGPSFLLFALHPSGSRHTVLKNEQPNRLEPCV